MIEFQGSAIQYDGFKILKADFDFLDAINYVPEMTKYADINIENESSFAVDSQKKSCNCVLHITCSFEGKNQADDLEPIPIGNIDIIVMGRSVAEFEDAFDEEDIRNTLEANVMSYLYGRSRSLIEEITNFCPNGLVTLPALLPTIKECETID